MTFKLTKCRFKIGANLTYQRLGHKPETMNAPGWIRRFHFTDLNTPPPFFVPFPSQSSSLHHKEEASASPSWHRPFWITQGSPDVVSWYIELSCQDKATPDPPFLGTTGFVGYVSLFFRRKINHHFIADIYPWQLVHDPDSTSINQYDDYRVEQKILGRVPYQLFPKHLPIVPDSHNLNMLVYLFLELQLLRKIAHIIPCSGCFCYNKRRIRMPHLVQHLSTPGRLWRCAVAAADVDDVVVVGIVAFLLIHYVLLSEL